MSQCGSRLALILFAPAALAASCGLAGSSSTTGGFGGGGGHATASSSSGDGGFVGAGAGTGGVATTVTSSGALGSGGANGGGGAGGAASGSGGALACTPADGVTCCEDDVACAGDLCCLKPDGSGLVCSAHCNAGLQPVPCETTTDCPGMECCGHWHHGPPATFDGIACKAACVPPPDPNMNDGDYQLCDTSQSDCAPMTTCTADPRLGGGDHGYCKP